MSSGKVRMVLAWWPELVAGGDCGVSWRLWCHVCKGLKKIMIRAFPMLEQISRAYLWSRHPEQTSRADIQSRPQHPMSERYSGDSWTIEGWFRSGVSSIGVARGRRSCNNLQSSRSRTTFLLSAEEPNKTLPNEPPPKEPKLNQTILTFEASLPSPSGPPKYASTLAPSVGPGVPIYTN
nr:hypothetical protein [Tanacetum cinerariifolium]